jgi:hypothetical protein
MKTHILVICRNKDILNTIKKLIDSQPGWSAHGAANEAEARELFSVGAYNIILIGSGIDDELATILEKEFRWINPSVKIVKHYGGGSGLLFGEIHEALRK